jgi:beta-glucosidase
MRNAEYREGIYTGYRYYEKARKQVRFAFGAGLSYTSFSYQELSISEGRVSVLVTNTGERFGGVPVLMFVHAPQDGIHRPLRELKGFEKIFLGPGQSREVCFDLDDRSFAVWDDGWKVFSGEYIIEIGTCTAVCQVGGEVFSRAETGRIQKTWYDSPEGIVSRGEWIKELGREPSVTPVRPFTVNSAVGDAAKHSLLIRLILWFFEKTAAGTYGRGTVNYLIVKTGAEESPLRRIQDALKTRCHFAQALADFANKKYFRGFVNLIR